MAGKVEIYVGATTMRTCLGDKNETLSAMRVGRSGLTYNKAFGMYTGMSDVKLIAGYTRFESLLIEQIANVLEQSKITLSDKNVQLIISTTKGNIELLAQDCENVSSRVFLYATAKVVADYFHCHNRPIVISNACISGLSAFVVARDILLSEYCRQVIVVGCDTLCEFITTGFASFKSISPAPCKPYDAERDGLTLGEACGAVLLSSSPFCTFKKEICLSGGSITNDANHISGPSRTGDGLYYAISQAMQEAGINIDDVGFINAHGTATRYNDDMESKAVAWAGLDAKPLNGIKGYIGHTLGASGVVETIVCIEELKQGYIFGTKNFFSTDTSYKLNVSSLPLSIEKRCCVKTASGFGGCNAAIVLDMENRENGSSNTRQIFLHKAKTVAEYVLPDSEQPFDIFIRSLFRSFGETNMKFYKMSDMCKALYVAVEQLLANENFDNITPTRRAIVLANRSASLDTDIVHQRLVNKHLPEGVSPAVFVYTLGNVAAGEMCIRHKIQGNNTFFIEDTDSGFAEQYARILMEKDCADAVICGWCEYLNGKWEVSVKLLKTN